MRRRSNVNENIYCIYDTQSQIALKPFMIHRNDVAPLREFQEIARNKDSLIAKHAKDFQLIQIGIVDLITLEVTVITPRQVATALDLIEGD